MKEEEIISLIRDRHYAKAGEKLYSYFPVVKKLVLKNSGSRQDAEDIYQEALLILIRKIQSGNFVLTSSLNTYIYGICRLLWNERLRKSKREINVDPLKTDAVSEEEAQTLQPDIQNQKMGEEAFRKLGEKCRQLLLLFYFKKLSLKEIADRLSFSSEKTAKNQKYRCLEKAKENLKILIAESHE